MCSYCIDKLTLSNLKILEITWNIESREFHIIIRLTISHGEVLGSVALAWGWTIGECPSVSSCVLHNHSRGHITSESLTLSAKCLCLWGLSRQDRDSGSDQYLDQDQNQIPTFIFNKDQDFHPNKELKKD